MSITVCQCGHRIYTNSVLSIPCPKCGAVVSCDPSKPSHNVARRRSAYRYRPSHWLPLHSYPVDNWYAWDIALAIAWYSEWLKGLPCGNCKQNWEEYTASCPPDFDSPRAFLDWSIAAHNHVSREHSGRPTMDAKPAADLWLGPKVAFLSATYARIGGTETFHKTLISRLRYRINVIGFACGKGGGDPAALGVPYFEGTEAMQKLARDADVIVTWGIDTLEASGNTGA